jgi:serine/threonine-protein kinase
MRDQTIGRYQIKAEIGRGGMATVYHAFDPQFQRDVALKLLPREFLHDPEFRRRFQREARTIARLEHPAIVPVYDFGDASGQLFLVMRLMTGGNLTARMESGPMPLPEIARIFGRLAQALDSAHGQGAIHRDLKPDNILFDQWDEPYLSDFGIVKLVEGSKTALTATGGIVGTPAYMSPEQVRAIDELDGRSDLYALGVILFEMLTGQQPYRAKTPMGQAIMHIHEPVPRILDTNPALPEGCQEIIDQVMAKDRNQRPDTASALARRIAQLALPLTAGQPPPPVPVKKPGAEAVAEETVQEALETLQEPLPVAPSPAASEPEATPAEEQIVQIEAEHASVDDDHWPQETELLEPALRLEQDALVDRQRPPQPPALSPQRRPSPGHAQPGPHIPVAAPAIPWIRRKWPWLGALAALLVIAVTILTLSPSGTEEEENGQSAAPQSGPTPLATKPVAAAERPPSGAVLGNLWTRPADGSELLFVPGGGFRMGSDAADNNAREDEFPQHLIKLSDFWIDRTETTNEQYARCVADGGCQPVPLAADPRLGQDKLPVAGVTWYDAQAYCAWVGARLPTESQWEYAARGPDQVIYPRGDQAPDCALSNFAGCGSAPVPAAGTYGRGVSWVGAAHMAGNVWEWVDDWYRSDWYQDAAVSDPPGPTSGGGKVLRGGSWDSTIPNLRAANRHGNDPLNRRLDFGFRCAMPAPE